MLRLVARSLLVVLIMMMSALAPARADLAAFLPNLVGSNIILDNPFHAAHFQASGEAAGTSLNQGLVQELTAISPLNSAAASFTYTFDPTLGTFNRSTESFGPLFTDRVQTVGSRRANVGVTFLHASYDKLDNLDFGKGLPFQAIHEDCCSPAGGSPPEPFFEGDVIGVTTRVDIKTDTAVFYGTYGLSDRFDVELAVPVIKIDLDGRSHYVINRLSTAGSPTIHEFGPGGTSTSDVSLSESATGIGDVLLRGKYRFFDNHSGGGLGAAVDVRFPTGKKEDLLGSGLTQYKLSLLGSAGFARAGLHGNVGYSTSSGSNDIIGNLPHQLSYSLALDVAVHPRATLVGEVLGRTLYNASRAELGTIAHVYQAGPSGPTATADLPSVVFVKGDVSELLGAVGVKFSPGGNVLLSVGGLFPLGNRGLQTSGATLVVGAESSF